MIKKLIAVGVMLLAATPAAPQSPAHTCIVPRFEYGNRDVSGPITQYWVNGRLQISPMEQVAFLRRFYRRS